MLYKFKQGYNTKEATKNICYVKDEGAINNQMVHEILLRLQEPWLSIKVR